KASSPLTISSDATVGGSFTFTAGNSASTTVRNDLTITNNATVTLTSATSATLRFEAGDSIVLGVGTATGKMVTAGAAAGNSNTFQRAPDLEGAGVADGFRGAVSQGSAFTAVQADNLLVTGAAGVGDLTTALGTKVTNLDVDNSTSGGVFVTNSGALT